MSRKNQNYIVSIDEPRRKMINIPNLGTAIYKSDKGNIVCKKDTIIQVAFNKKHHRLLKLAFQLALRYADNWNRHFQLKALKKNRNKRSVERSKPVSILKLKYMWTKLSELDEDVLMFLHRASDFTDKYSEVTAVNALFGLEIAINIAYRKFQKYLPPEEEVENVREKIDALHGSDIITSHKDIRLLLALVSVRNKLAHVKWTRIKTAGVSPLSSCICLCHERGLGNPTAMGVLRGPNYITK